MEKKIAILVEPDFVRPHVGVRHYLQSLHALLSRRHRVDWITCERDPGGERRWYHLIPPPAGHGGAVAELVCSGRPAEVLRQSAGLPDPKHARVAGCRRTEIGSDLSVEDYDAIIIGYPWLVDFESRLPARRVLGVVYDLVPNHYVFSMPSSHKPFFFAARHRRGFVHYRDHCDTVLAISSAVATDYARVFEARPGQVVTVPPLLPASYQHVPDANNERSPRVVLAAPFDRRKGLAVMPAILNAAATAIDTVSIYGGVRCTYREVQEFFRALEVRHVEWYPQASAATVHRLFLESKALLFPSFEEGLGLPVLEAQRCGCRVMIRDKPPLSDLAGPGSYLLPATEAEAGAALARMVREPFDHATLQQWARDEYGGGLALDAVSAAVVPAATRGLGMTGTPQRPDASVVRPR